MQVVTPFAQCLADLPVDVITVSSVFKYDATSLAYVSSGSFYIIFYSIPPNYHHTSLFL